MKRLLVILTLVFVAFICFGCNKESNTGKQETKISTNTPAHEHEWVFDHFEWLDIIEGEKPIYKVRVYLFCEEDKEEMQVDVEAELVYSQEGDCVNKSIRVFNVSYLGKTETKTIEFGGNGHTKGDIVKENIVLPTCTTDGSHDEVIYCALCNEELERTNVVDKTLGHDVVHHEGKEPTCTEPGFKEYDTCSRCDYSTFQEISALGHEESEMVVENLVPATCTQDGSHDEVKYCTVCKEELSRTSVVDKALGHDVVHHEGKEPTCTEPGFKEYDTCSRCDYSTFQELSALGHTEGEVTIENVVAPTCTADGSHDEVKYCTVCKAELERTNVIDKALGHTEGEVTIENVVAPTCTQDGSHDEVKYCTVCKAELERTNVVDKSLGHTEGEVTIENVVAPTCTADGSHDEVKYCTVCKAELERTNVVDKALGHDLVHHDGKNPTCTESGWKEYDTCSRCDYTTIVMIDALGHDLVHHDGKNPTCTESGWKEYDTCTRCSYTTYETLDALGHNYVSQVIDPTKITEGYTNHTCSRCSDSYIDSYTVKTIYTPNLEYELNERGKLTLVGIGTYNGTELNVTPSLGGIEVDSVSERAFYNNTTLTKVKLPDTIKYIGNYAFYSCSNLSILLLPDILYPCVEFDGAWTVEGDTITSPSIQDKMTYNKSVYTIESIIIKESGLVSFTYWVDGYVSEYIEIILNGEVLSKVKANGSSSSDKRYDIEFVATRGDVVELKYMVPAEFVSTSIGTERAYITNFKYVTSKEAISSSLEIGSYAFSNCSSLAKVILPSFTTKLGEKVLYSSKVEALETPLLGENKDSSQAISYLFGGTTNRISTLKKVIINNKITLNKSFENDDYLEWVVLDDRIEDIGENAFYECTSLSNANLPKSLKMIGTYAFRSAKVTELYLPSTLESIGSHAFFGTSTEKVYYDGNAVQLFNLINVPNGTFVSGENCKLYIKNELGEYELLNTLVIPEGVKVIYSYALCNLNSLENLTIPTTVTTIEDHALSGTLSIKYFESPFAFVSLSNLFDNKGTFKSSLEEMKLTSGTAIKSAMFSDYAKLKKVTLPEGITTIGYQAFYNCSSLEEINLPSTLKEINGIAFSGCSSLQSIVLVAEITTIDSNAFKDCTGLTKVDIYLKDEVLVSNNQSKAILYGCSNINELVIHSDASIYGLFGSYKPNINILRFADTKTVHDGGSNTDKFTNLIIDEGVETLSERGTSSDYTNVRLPKSLKLIEAGNFDMGTYSATTPSLTNIYYDGTLSDWCKIEFAYDANLLKFAKNIYLLDENGSVEFMGKKYSLMPTTITTPRDIESIGNLQFAFMKNITGIVITNNIKEIGIAAFYNCENLETIEFEDDSILETIHGGAFVNCKKIKDLYLPSSLLEIKSNDYISNSYYNQPFYNAVITNAYIPASISNLLPEMTVTNLTFTGSGEIYTIVSATNLYIESSVTSIGRLMTCTNIYFKGTINDWLNVKINNKYYNPASNCSHFYINNKEETSITISSGTSIGDYQFSGFKNLTSVTIYAGIKTIGARAFADCTSLSEIIFLEDSELESISDDAFANDTAILDLTIPFVGNGVDKYEVSDIFVSSLSNIRYLEINGKNASLTSGCLYGLRGLKTIKLSSAITDVVYGVFDTLKIESAEVPCSAARYIATSSTKATLKTIKVNGGTNLYASSFSGITTLTSVELADSVTSIGNSAFWGCSSLTSVTMSNNVTLIDDYAFYNCTSLASITLSTGLQTIAFDAFNGCSKLSSITLPASIQLIKSRAFSNCTKLTTIKYSGTKAAFALVELFDNWTTLTTVKCSDGNYTL